MSSDNLNLEWIILTHGDFLQKFGIDKERINSTHSSWQIENSDKTITEYFYELLRQATLYIIKNTDTEEDYYNSKFLLDKKMLDYGHTLSKDERNFLLGQIHFDRLQISRLTLPFKFDIQIESTNCCLYCDKNNKKIFTFEKVLEKKYLPFRNCKNENGCICSYSVVVRHDENGKLISKDIL
jgi:hypothetical protein